MFLREPQLPKNNRKTTTGWHAPVGDSVLEAYWLVRAPQPISGSRGSHGGLGGRSEIATLNRPFSRGRGAAASTLNGFARQ